MLEDLERDILFFISQGHIIILGDFNARTGNYKDYIENNGHNFIQHDLSAQMQNISPRKSFDNTINNHGKWLLELCKPFNMRILNGRINGDSFGQPTSHKCLGVSAVDYAIVSHELFKYVKSFIVRPPIYMSDHSQIIGNFSLPFSKKNQGFEPNEKEKGLPYKATKPPEKWTEYFRMLHSNPNDADANLQSNFQNTLNNLENSSSTYHPILDKVIDYKDIAKALAKLKHKKAASNDKIKNEMIKNELPSS